MVEKISKFFNNRVQNFAIWETVKPCDHIPIFTVNTFQVASIITVFGRLGVYKFQYGLTYFQPWTVALVREFADDQGRLISALQIIFYFVVPPVMAALVYIGVYRKNHYYLIPFIVSVVFTTFVSC